MKPIDRDTKVADVMTPNPTTLPSGASVADAARVMRHEDIGCVLVSTDNGVVRGLVTDRDITVRAVAEGRDPESTTLGDVCSFELVQLHPSDTVVEAARIMAEYSVRRLRVVDGGDTVGIVSLGDLAQARDPASALGAISSAPPNR
jgi:CBS domain-containing protein